MGSFFILEIIGTVAFAVSGALIGIKHKMDLFGVTVLGLVTAVGGGVLRDIVIGSTPPAVFRDPSAALIALAVSVTVFSFYYFLNRYTEKSAARVYAEETVSHEMQPVSAIVAAPTATIVAVVVGEVETSPDYKQEVKRSYRIMSHTFLKNETVRRYSEALLFLADTVGLAVFTVIGTKNAIEVYPGNYAVLIFVGVITGTGGGVVRDLLSVSIPVIFKKHIYAIASLLGAFVCAFLMNITNGQIAVTAGVVTVTVIRLCAARFKWNLPVIKN